MRASAFIRTTASPKNGMAKATVYFRVRDNECDIKAASELAILPNYWDAKRQGYKLRVSLVGEQQRQDFDHAVQEILALISKEYYKESRIPSPIQISIIASVLRPNVPNTPILSVDQPQN